MGVVEAVDGGGPAREEAPCTPAVVGEGGLGDRGATWLGITSGTPVVGAACARGAAGCTPVVDGGAPAMPGAAGVVVGAVGAELRTPGWPAGTPAYGGGVASGETAAVVALCATTRSATEAAGSGAA
jgi:hypothetical protein